METTAAAQAASGDSKATRVATLKRAYLDNLHHLLAKDPESATRRDRYMALAYAVRERLVDRWLNTSAAYNERKSRIVGYLSAEYLLGPKLMSALLSLGIEEETRQAATELGFNLADVVEAEPDPGLGNGGLGRLAACFLDSLATLEYPAVGYGLRYEFGTFNQHIKDGWQVEAPDQWLQMGNPWEIPHPELSADIPFGGRTQSYTDSDGRYRVKWIPDRVVRGIPYDTIIPGYRNNTGNTLRLWKAEAPEVFNFAAFNVGDFYGAVRDEVQSETISKILYPNDETLAGKELRLEQQFFFVSASLQDTMRLLRRRGAHVADYAQHFALQLNDTHPTIGVAELMRLLVDVHDLEWDQAWQTTQQVFGYTNHTLLPEALERWPIKLFGSLLPRHLEIIYEINRRFLDTVRAKYPGDDGKVQRLSLIDESGERYVRMANLAATGSHAINGVAALHTKLLEKDVLKDFFELHPERFSNKTNGITPRRWLLESAPQLASLITSRIGEGWITDLDQLKGLEPFAEDAAFRHDWRAAQESMKRSLAKFIELKTEIVVDSSSLFDVIVKRIHEYKRQHLKVLHMITEYHRLKANPGLDVVPRTFVFGGKAAPSYFMAKLIIKLINSVAHVVNNDPVIAGRLRVVFLPNYSVSLGQRVYPAADLSEQISLAGKEASGTGNMKFALDGALTIGTLDGANIEIRERVGEENFFLFGLTVGEVNSLKDAGYNPRTYYEADAELRGAIDAISGGEFGNGDRKLFRPLVDNLLNTDPYLLCADYRAYIDCQDRVDAAYRDHEQWTRMSVLNTARMGYFSSDRAIHEYATEIWTLKPEPI
jgi:glycogen phosphorylase